MLRLRGAVIILGMLFMLLPACKDSEIPEFSLPETSILSVRKNWAVVTFNYLPLYSEARISSDIVWEARKGDVFEVLEQSLETEYLYSSDDYWYRISSRDGVEGWAFGAGLESYSSVEEARNAASRLDDEEGF